jgi:hypothetical protein
MGSNLSRLKKIICLTTAIGALKIITRTVDPVILAEITAELIGGCLMLCIIITALDNDFQVMRLQGGDKKEQD